MKLSGKTKRLYKEKRYSELFDILGATAAGADLFIELCREDNGLCAWWGKEQARMWDQLNANPEMNAVVQEMAEAGGFGELYDFFKNSNAVGFVTAEEVEKHLGIPIEEQERIIEKNPELFRGKLFKTVLQ